MRKGLGANVSTSADREALWRSQRDGTYKPSRSPAAAEVAYRATWSAYLLASDPETKRALEVMMDRLQLDIATRPTDEAWVRFAASLPGYLEHWADLKRRVVP